MITCTFNSWTCSYPHQVFIWLSLYHRSGRLSPRLCVAHSLIRFRFQGIPKFLGRPPYTMFSTHLLFPRKLSHEVLRAQHQMRANMVAFMIEQAHKLLVLPKKRQTSEVPQLCQRSSAWRQRQLWPLVLLLITSLKVFVIDILFVSGMNTGSSINLSLKSGDQRNPTTSSYMYLLKVRSTWIDIISFSYTYTTRFTPQKVYLLVWTQTWNLSKILHDQIFGPKILHTKNA